MIGTELETLLRRLIREELERLLGDEQADDEDLRRLAAERAARLRTRRGGGR